MRIAYVVAVSLYVVMLYGETEPAAGVNPYTISTYVNPLDTHSHAISISKAATLSSNGPTYLDSTCPP